MNYCVGSVFDQFRPEGLAVKEPSGKACLKAPVGVSDQGFFFSGFWLVLTVVILTTISGEHWNQ
jgi:hypothetical protein